MFLITEYDKRYRPFNKSGGELKNPEWVKLPAKPKGDGLETLFEHHRGLEVFGIWCLLLEKTTTEKDPKNRGKLLNHKGEAATIEDIAKGICLKRQIKLVEHALSVLVAMDWVKNNSVTEQTSAKRGNNTPPKISEVKLSKDKIKELPQKNSSDSLSNQAYSLMKVRLGINDKKIKQLISLRSVKSLEQTCMNGLAKEKADDKFTLQAGYIITAMETAAFEEKPINPTNHTKNLSNALKAKPERLTPQEYQANHAKQKILIEQMKGK